LPFELDLDLPLPLPCGLFVGAAAAVVVVLVVLVVLVPVVVVDEQVPPAGATKSPCLMCAGTARSLTMISTKGFFFECVR